MEEKIKILLEKINIGEESFQYFNDARILKVKINPNNKSYNIVYFLYLYVNLWLFVFLL